MDLIRPGGFCYFVKARICPMRGGDQHQRPEHIDVSEKGRLRLHLLTDPCKRLSLRLPDRGLELDCRRIDEFNEPTLKELLGVCEVPNGEKPADLRSTERRAGA
jgi:hypothetical protein